RGLTWLAPGQVSFTPAESSHTNLAFVGSTAHFAWFDYPEGRAPEAYYRSSPDLGLTWGATERFPSEYTPILAGTTPYVHARSNEGGQYWYRRRGVLSMTPTDGGISPIDGAAPTDGGISPIDGAAPRDGGTRPTDATTPNNGDVATMSSCSCEIGETRPF